MGTLFLCFCNHRVVLFSMSTSCQHYLTKGFLECIIFSRRMYNMSYNIKCPECGAEQKNLNLEETNGSYVCSKCDKQTTVDLEKIRKA